MLKLKSQFGFGLLEMIVAIIVIGILMAVAMQSMTSLVDDARLAKTERELELLANSIVGNPDISHSGGRANFGYVGDIGSFPPNLDALYNNPGSYLTWNGPYLPDGFTQDSTGLKTDEWGLPYNYSGGITITSTGSGTTITKKIADASSDYLLNTINGIIKDGSDRNPGSVFRDSVDIIITVPNGSGGLVTKLYHPSQSGTFTLDSIPAGNHPLKIIFTPNGDTLSRFLTVFPRHKSPPVYKFNGSYFTGGGCDSTGTVVLRPSGNGSLTNLSNDGCSNNWQCVDEITSDGDATRVERASNSFATDVYNLQDPPATSCEVLSVTVFCRARFSQAVGDIMPTVYVSGSEYNGAQQTMTTSYELYSHQWTTNPNTGAAWSWTEITNLQAGTRMSGQNAVFPAYCTQVWVEVNY